jgi:hypothetical protein
MDNLKTLAEIWEYADRKPIFVTHKDNMFPKLMVGIQGNHAWFNGHNTEYNNVREWKLHKEKKLVEHWPAIYEAEKGYYYISNDIFPTEIMAKEVLRKRFIRLATELPPIMLEVDDEDKPK